MELGKFIKDALDYRSIETNPETGSILGARRHELKFVINDGYALYCIRHNGVSRVCSGHRIIWIAVNGLYDKNLFDIDHKNKNRLDNRIENLRLLTHKDNRSVYKYSPEDRKQIYDFSTILGMSQREIASLFNTGQSTIAYILKNYVP
jgi:hypothetical protein